MAVALIAGFVLTNSRHELGDPPGSDGMVFYLLVDPILVVLTGSAVAAALGRSFRSGVWACAWAVVLAAPLLIAAWLAEALRWYQQGQGTALDGAGGLGAGVNLGDAVWWPLVFLALWAVPWGWSARRSGARVRTASRASRALDLDANELRYRRKPDRALMEGRLSRSQRRGPCSRP